MKGYSHDRRDIYDADYFSNGGVERRKGSWERRSRKDRRLSGDRRSARDRRATFNSKYMFVPVRRGRQDRRIGADRRIKERRGNIDARKVEINRKLLLHLGRLEEIIGRQSHTD